MAGHTVGTLIAFPPGSTAFEFIVREAEATAPPARMVVLRV